MNDRLTQFERWANEGRRSVSIEIDNHTGNGEVKIWVFDYDLMEGQFVKSVDEINIEAVKAAKEKALYEKLKTIFEPARQAV